VPGTGYGPQIVVSISLHTTIRTVVNNTMQVSRLRLPDPVRLEARLVISQPE